MFEAPSLMKMAQGLARHAGARQAQIAKNIANADVPGYRARDVIEFSETYRQQTDAGLQLTRTKHMAGQTGATAMRTFDVGDEASPNGNNVSVEVEMARGTEAKSSHELALAVYKSSLDILRASLGRGR